MVIIVLEAERLVQLSAVPELHVIGVEGPRLVAAVLQEARKTRKLLINIRHRCRTLRRNVEGGVDYEFRI
ncbi:hypothetical protein D3C75_513270 [compost metagenome]